MPPLYHIPILGSGFAGLGQGFFHVLNRGNHRQKLFHEEDDYALFLGLLSESLTRYKVALWGYCLMGNHWHMVVEVKKMEELSGWMHWLCNRHVRLTHQLRREWGGGHVYQGRYKSFPIQDEIYMYEVLRYVEANPVRAGLVERGRDWPWSSLSSARIKRDHVEVERPRLQPWVRDAAWQREVDRPLEEERISSLRQSAQRGTPQGRPAWIEHLAIKYGLASTIRPRGRPRKLTIAS